MGFKWVLTMQVVEGSEGSPTFSSAPDRISRCTVNTTCDLDEFELRVCDAVERRFSPCVFEGSSGESVWNHL
jgi:hypothetical protein